MNEHIEQQICIKFCGKLKHSPVETKRIVWGLKIPTLKGTQVSLSYVLYFL